MSDEVTEVDPRLRSGSEGDSDRERLVELADEQAALRRVATLVANGVPPAQIFDAVTNEARRVLDVDTTALMRVEADGTTVTILASDTGLKLLERLGDPFVPPAGGSVDRVLRTGTPTRIDWRDHAAGVGPAVEYARGYDFPTAVAAPVVVQGRLWGVHAVLWARERTVPPGKEERVVQFTELLATAIANAEGRAELMASRARIVAASDEARRQVQRNLHDGAQQLVVSLALRLKALAVSDTAHARGIDDDLLGFAADLDEVLQELRDISGGLHPAVLSRGGLEAALKALARRSPIPVALCVRASERMPDRVEIAAYYVVAEMLTNAAKHARASRIDVGVEPRGGVLHVSVRDDGVGGADPASGSGLVGLNDRLEALGGAMTLDSPPGGGTRLIAQLPLETPAGMTEPATA